MRMSTKAEPAASTLATARACEDTAAELSQDASLAVTAVSSRPLLEAALLLGAHGLCRF